MKTCAVILAAGSSQRFGSDKLWLDLDGNPLWTHSFRTFLDHPRIDGVGIVCPGAAVDRFRHLAPEALFVVAGGVDRRESSRLACGSVPSSYDAVLIHDAARPFVSGDLISRVIDGVLESGAAYPAVPVTDTIKQGEGSHWTTLPRKSLVAAQTPQGASRDLLLRAHKYADGDVTDDVSLLELSGTPVLMVPGETANIKVTHQSDLNRMNGPTEIRTGFGYDVHAFSHDAGRPLWLGGVEFDDRPGLEGHSDADVLLHAITDALLGAVGLGDIGIQYPNTDQRWKNAASSIFLRESASKVRETGWTIVNIDATVLAERPKLSSKRDLVCSTIADIVGIGRDRVSVKATTHEGLGAIGRAEGIAAQAVVTLSRS